MLSISLRGVSKQFGTANAAPIAALTDISLTVEAAEFVIVVGANGSGKSTLLNVISGNLECDIGEISVLIDGKKQNWLRQSAGRRARFSAMVAQNPSASSIGEFAVVENIKLASIGRHASPFRRSLSGAARTALMSKVHSDELRSKANFFTSDLSHGQQQMLALEMAAIRNAQLILLDEHTASLDRKNARICMEQTETLCKATRATVIMVTHDLEFAKQYGDRLIVLRDGCVTADVAGPTKVALTIGKISELCGYDDGPRIDPRSAQ